MTATLAVMLAGCASSATNDGTNWNPADASAGGAPGSTGAAGSGTSTSGGGSTGTAGSGPSSGAAGSKPTTGAAGSSPTTGVAGSFSGAAGSNGVAGSGAGGVTGGHAGTGGAGVGVGGAGGHGPTGTAGSSAGGAIGVGGFGPTGAGGASAGAGGASAGGRSGTGGRAGTSGAAGATGAAGASTGLAGSSAAGANGAAGSAPPDGGVVLDGGDACVPDDMRCGSTGRRQRCVGNNTWADETFVCTVQLAGSTDYRNICAVKGDGSLSCWGTSSDFEQKQATTWSNAAPKKTWTEVSVSDGPWQACALNTTGKASCWSASPSNVVFQPTDTFKHYVTTIYGDCGIRSTTGELACYNGTTLPAGYTGKYVQVSVANQAVFAIDDQGTLHKPDFVSFPDGKYIFVSANNSAACAVRNDGRIFCHSPSQAPQDPPDEASFVQVAMEYNYYTACGLRRDGTLACWPGQSGVTAPTPPAGQFTQLASFQTGYCAIRRDGTTSCWGDAIVVPLGW